MDRSLITCILSRAHRECRRRTLAARCPHAARRGTRAARHHHSTRVPRARRTHRARSASETLLVRRKWIKCCFLTYSQKLTVLVLCCFCLFCDHIGGDQFIFNTAVCLRWVHVVFYIYVGARTADLCDERRSRHELHFTVRRSHGRRLFKSLLLMKQRSPRTIYLLILFTCDTYIF